MTGKLQRTVAVAGLVGAIGIFGVGVAYAGVSTGTYSPHDQNCSGHADDIEHDDDVEQGCQSSTANVGDGNDDELARVGTQQTPDGERGHQVDSTTDPNGFDPTTGMHVYFGADDNLDSGEHDSSDQIGDGPSDGGGIQFNVTPGDVQVWVAHLQAGDSAYLLTHPLPGIDTGGGGCADGNCFTVTSVQRTAYEGGHGPDAEPDRDAADYDGHTWDPETCAGPSDTAEDCQSANGISDWNDRNGTVSVEPGAQVYEDPNPEGSPIGPDYPIPAAYVGTCGVIAGGGPVQAPASPITNGAGQLHVDTGC